MQQIELTEAHKEKLLEMCKVLFPEYKIIYWDHYESHLGFSKDEKSSTSIHWFEFLFTHIVDKIIYLGSKRLRDCQNDHYKMLMEMMKLFYQEEGTHPVDYLYEEFLKLKS